MSAFRINIINLRKSKGLTQEKFAEILKIKRSTLGAYEEGRSLPRIKEFLEMCDLFKVNPKDFYRHELSFKNKIKTHIL